jgi:hypothetical protein|tara:strand:+ start:2878 stop:3498 length:621 start_codon:yes stop_codon:yes gene_type:complete
MSFRCEEKLRISKSKIFELKNWISKNSGEVLFPSRIINSIYFDNQNFTMYHHSIEGVLPRKKIRLRNYKKEFKFFETANKEIKISSVEGRYKISEKINEPMQIINLGIYDLNYGICVPVLNVVYQRSYYRINNIRLTLDEKIIYKRVDKHKISELSTFDDYNVVELKFNSSKFYKTAIQEFPFERFRFSKYCRGIEFIRLNYCNEL